MAAECVKGDMQQSTVDTPTNGSMALMTSRRGEHCFATATVLAISDTSEASPDERFADSVCMVQATTYDEILDVLDAVVHTRATPGEDGWAYLAVHAHRAHVIMQSYRRKIKAIEIPDTYAGRRVARFIEDFTRIPLSRTSEAVRRINRVNPKGMTLVQNIRALNDLQRDLDFVRGEMISGGLFAVPNIDTGLHEEFQNADSCTKIGAQMRDVPDG